MVYALTVDNLAKYSCIQHRWRDLLQEYLDSLVTSDSFEPLQENENDDGITSTAETGALKSTATASIEDLESLTLVDKSNDPPARRNARPSHNRHSRKKAPSTEPTVATNEDPSVQLFLAKTGPPNVVAILPSTNKDRIWYSHPQDGDMTGGKDTSRTQIATPPLTNKDRIWHPHSQGREGKEVSEAQIASRKTAGSRRRPVKAELNSNAPAESSDIQSRPDVATNSPSKAGNGKDNCVSNDNKEKSPHNEHRVDETPLNGRRRNRRRRGRPQPAQEEAQREAPERSPLPW